MKLFFRKSGEGKPLVILHGLFGMSDNWMSLSKQFASEGFLVYAVDARNHGRSPHSNDFNYSFMSDDLLALMDDEHISSAALIGHSMGGKTAMWFACQHPDRVVKLIVADMAPRYYPPHHQSVFAALHAVDLDSITTRKEVEGILRESLKEEGTIQFLLKNLYWNEQEKLAWRFNLEGIEKNISSIGTALPDQYHCDAEALFLRGEKSGYIANADIPAIRKQFSNSTVESVAKAGHWIHAENPTGFMEAANAFLK
ncbi:MAG: alpha/beta fold hydrolase [Bacteroidota bacterium]